MKSYETLTVGQIVTDKYGAANVFENTVSTTVATVPHRCSKPVKMQM